MANLRTQFETSVTEYFALKPHTVIIRRGEEDGVKFEKRYIKPRELDTPSMISSEVRHQMWGVIRSKYSSLCDAYTIIGSAVDYAQPHGSITLEKIESCKKLYEAIVFPEAPGKISATDDVVEIHSNLVRIWGFVMRDILRVAGRLGLAPIELIYGHEVLNDKDNLLATRNKYMQ